MDASASSYSYSQGIQLLENVVQEFGPIFTFEQISSAPQAQQFTSRQIQQLVSKLSRSGWIEILKRGTYVVKRSLYPAEVSPFAIAAALVQPVAISHWSALAHHGFTTQIPTMVQASTPQKIVTPEMRKGKAYSPRGRATWWAYGLEFEFIYVKLERFWGFQSYWAGSWQQVDITDPERTALDLIARPDIIGGIGAAGEILDGALPRLNIERLVAYALRYDVGSVVKRLGWLLEKMGTPPNHLAPLREYPVRAYYPLDPTQPRGEINNSRWRINENLRKPQHAQRRPDDQAGSSQKNSPL